MTSISPLFKEFQIDSLTLKNRLVVAPMTRVSATSEGIPTEIMKEHYQEYSKGGWGLIITEGTYIDESFSQGYRNQPGIANKQHIENWKKIVDAVHISNTPIFLQLIHAGGLIQENIYQKRGIAPSRTELLGKMLPHYFGEGKFPVPMEITKEQIAKTVSSFASAAKNALEAGFDGIEIHGANGYLLDQFLTVFSNHRNDEYGGDIKNRIRFHCEVLQGVLDAIKGKIPVGMRISQTKVNNFEYEWPGGETDASFIFKKMKSVGPSYVHVSTHKGLEPVWQTRHNLAYYAKKYFEGTVIACGGLHDPKKAANLLNKQEADLAAVGKGAIANPNLPNDIYNKKDNTQFVPEMIRPFATIENTRRWRKKNL